MSTDLFPEFIKRIDRGEIDQGDRFNERVRKFANEVIIATDQGLLSGKQAAKLWLVHLKRLGHRVDIPEDEQGRL